MPHIVPMLIFPAGDVKKNLYSNDPSTVPRSLCSICGTQHQRPFFESLIYAKGAETGFPLSAHAGRIIPTSGPAVDWPRAILPKTSRKAGSQVTYFSTPALHIPSLPQRLVFGNDFPARLLAVFPGLFRPRGASSHRVGLKLRFRQFAPCLPHRGPSAPAVSPIGRNRGAAPRLCHVVI